MFPTVGAPACGNRDPGSARMCIEFADGGGAYVGETGIKDCHRPSGGSSKGICSIGILKEKADTRT